MSQNKPAIICSISTLDRQYSIALASQSKTWAKIHTQGESSEFLVGSLQQLLIDSDCHWANVKALLVNTGPGSYTGLRVGIASCCGLAIPRKLPVWTSSDLSIQAIQAHRATGRSGIYWVMTDARLGEVYTAIFWVDHQSLLVIKPDCVMSVSSLSDFIQKRGLNQERITLVGDAWYLLPNYVKRKPWVKPDLEQRQWLSKAEVMVKMFQQLKPDVRSCFKQENYQQIEARYLREHRV